MRKGEGKTAHETESKSAKPGAAQPPSAAGSSPNPGGSKEPGPPKYQQSGLLKIEVPTGASRQQVSHAIEQALKLKDIAFFRAKTVSPGQAGTATAPGSSPGDRCDEDTLMIVLDQEGW